MGNETSRSSTSRSSFRRSRRHSKNTGQNYIAEDEMDKNIQEDPIPKPAKRLDRIRRSLSFRRRKKPNDKCSTKNQLQQKSDSLINDASGSSNQPTETGAPKTVSTNPISKENTSNQSNAANNSSANNTENGSSKPAQWIEDEKKVRAGNCSFQVKYLGFQEVTDSRGMHICEMAIEKLLADKDKKTNKLIKAILYVSGDSLRVVDESNKTLLVDQTIEKVSFCAPDRHHENGFAYICRDGTARRWLCHGFMAIKDTLKGTSAGTGAGCSGGERLSHAVGCAFSVCLEKKQRRERENVSMEVGPNHSFTRLGSFRQASLTERFEDPQMVMPAAQPVPIKQVDNPHAIERPKASMDSFNRMNPLRTSGGIGGGGGTLSMPFKRNTAAYTSLKPGELPSFKQQKMAGFEQLSNDSHTLPPQTKTSFLLQQQQQLKQSNNPMVDSSITNLTTNSNPLTKSDTFNQKINTINELPEEAGVDAINNKNVANNQLSEAIQLTDRLNLNQINITSDSTNVQKQYYHQLLSNSSVFSTPVTPSSVNNLPPPLPPMPSQYVKSLVQSNVSNDLNSQFNQLSQINQLNNQFVATNSTHNILPLNLTPIVSPPLMASPSSTSISATQNSMYINNSNSNETFEQKWARIQAAKKTNPFADDIAKKFEIKL